MLAFSPQCGKSTHIPRPERDENYEIAKGYKIRTSDDEDDVNNQLSANMLKRRKSNGKHSSYPNISTARGSTAADSSETAPKKRMLKKKLYKKFRAFKTSLDSDQGCHQKIFNCNVRRRKKGQRCHLQPACQDYFVKNCKSHEITLFFFKVCDLFLRNPPKFSMVENLKLP